MADKNIKNIYIFKNNEMVKQIDKKSSKNNKRRHLTICKALNKNND